MVSSSKAHLQAQTKITILTGPTASGKTALALKAAEALQSATVPGQLEIINADSLLVFREFNIGTAKPTLQELSHVPHHLINIRDPDQSFDAASFVQEVMTAITEIGNRGATPLIVGGSGFYLKALIFGLWKGPETQPEFRKAVEHLPTGELYAQLLAQDLESANKIGQNDRYRLIRALEIIKYSGQTPSSLQASHPEQPNPLFELVVIDRDQSELEERILQRTELMLEQGWIKEVKSIREKFPLATGLKSIGYQQICDHLDGVLPAGRKLRSGQQGLLGLKDEINLATRQLIKTQRTFYKSLLSKIRTQTEMSDSYLQEYYILGRDEQSALAKILKPN